MSSPYEKLYGDGIHDDTDAVQRKLDQKGLIEIPHGTYLISRPLIIHDDTHLKLAKTAVFHLADHANCSLLDNDGLYSDKINRNITIEGGIWDGNHCAQDRQKIPNEGVPGDDNEDQPCDKELYLSNIYLILMMRLVHVENLKIQNLTFKNPTTFAVQIADVNKFVVENITLDYDLIRNNMDGIHVQGPARFGRIRNISGNANDDHVALCANGTTRSAITHGPIEDVTIDGVYCDNGYTGVRLLSRGDPVRNIRISNIHGAFRYFALSFTHHYPLRDDMPILIENVTVSNLFIAKTQEAIERDLTIRKSVRPLIWVEDGVNCKNVLLENIHVRRNAKKGVVPTLVVSETATTENFIVRNVVEE